MASEDAADTSEVVTASATTTTAERVGIDAAGAAEVHAEEVAVAVADETRVDDGTPPTSVASGGAEPETELEVVGSDIEGSERRKLAVATRFGSSVAVAAGAYAGVATRLLLNALVAALTRWLDGGVETSVPSGGLLWSLDHATASGGGFLLPNVVGCVVMGLSLALAETLGIPRPLLYTGVTTGFCGCCTTFSSWMVFTASELNNGRVASAITSLLVHMACYIAGFRSGRLLGGLAARRLAGDKRPARAAVQSKIDALLHDMDALLGTAEDDNGNTDGNGGDTKAADDEDVIEPVARPEQQLSAMRRELVRKRRLYAEAVNEAARHRRVANTMAAKQSYWQHLTSRLMAVFVLVTLIVWLVGGFADAVRAQFWAVGLAPFGALTRKYLSTFNKRKPPIVCPCFDATRLGVPVYTLLPNVAASALSALMAAVGTAGAANGGTAIAAAVGLGFCGTLSTVSTFVAETSTLPVGRLPVMYVATSWLLSALAALAGLQAAG